MNDKLYSEYGNAGHKFPRSVKEAYGRDEAIIVHTEIDDDEDDDISNFYLNFSLAVYTMAAVVIMALWWRP